MIMTHALPSQQTGEPAAGHARGGNNAPHVPPMSPFKGRRRTALLWSVGGTVFSAVGFIALALFEQYNDSLSELRHDLKHFNETSGDLVKKENLRRFRDQLKKWAKDLQDAKEARVLMKRELVTSESTRREMTHVLQGLRERLASVEGRQAATPVVIAAAPPGAQASH